MGVNDKPLTPEEQFAACDFTNRASIVGLFPAYAQEQYALKVANKKNVSKAVNIESFTLQTPYKDRDLLKSTPLTLEAGKRQGLVGANGTGKTLLFDAMSSGSIKDFPKHIHVHHCKELENHELSESVIDTVVNCYPYRNILLKVEGRLKELLAADPAPEGAVKEALSDNLQWISFEANVIKAYDARDRVSKMLRVLGFDENGQARLCSALSGGLRMRVALAMAFFIEADLLLLDEPTNHLDFPSVLWLENRLRGYRGSFLMVSHDRELLNNVCTSVLLLEDLQIKYYMMGFKEFEKKKAEEDKKKFAEIEKFLEKNRNADPSTFLGAQRAEKKAWSDKYYQKQVALAGKFTFPESVKLSNAEGVAAEDISLINLQNLTFSYDATVPADKINWIFKDEINFNCTASTRMGVMGPNGAGKSTLLKLLTQKLKPVTGTVVHHPKYTLAYFGQHSTAELELDLTAFEFMSKQFPEEGAGTIRQHLAKTSIVGVVQDTRMERLSFSQRSCIIFSKLTFVCPHLLILDEPTNFLDLESVDSLIAACNKYAGALLLVSHNRDFLKRCAKGYLSIVPGRFEVYDNLKSAERATYTFIAEMEEGGKVGASALVNNPGGGSVHPSLQKKKDAAQNVEMVDGMRVLTFGGDAPVAKKVAPKVEAVAWKEGDKCQALWTDGKWYAAVVKKVLPAGKGFSVTYTAYGNTATVPAASLKKEEPKAAAKPGAKPAAGAAAKAGGKK